MRPALALLSSVVAMLAFSEGQALGADAQTKVRVLLLSGQNNHDWKKTTPKIQSLLTATGRFAVDITEHPERLDRKSLEPYDVIVSNWNNFSATQGGRKAAPWPEATAAAYVDFVRGGKGHVVVHAGSSSFPDWAEYQELALATWKAGRTGHSPIHKFSVKIDLPDHPVAAGLSGFKTRDELWYKPLVAKGATVLASALSSTDAKGAGNYEPVALVGKCGQGRCFTLLLGHDAQTMGNPGFATLLVRGTEWAGRGAVAIGAVRDDN
jgi:uncharacterized protein